MRGNHDGPGWPGWAEPLRPDTLARRRLRRDVLARAEALLRVRRESWQDVASGWAAMLIPIAAVLLLLFTALAYRATLEMGASPVAAAPEARAPASPPEPLERSYEELVAADDAPPGLLTGAEEPSRDAVLSAVIRTGSDPRPGGR